MLPEKQKNAQRLPAFRLWHEQLHTQLHIENMLAGVPALTLSHLSHLNHLSHLRMHAGVPNK